MLYVVIVDLTKKIPKPFNYKKTTVAYFDLKSLVEETELTTLHTNAKQLHTRNSNEI